MQTPSVKRRSKVQDPSKAFIHLHSFTILNCKNQFKVSKRNGFLTLLLCLLLLLFLLLCPTLKEKVILMRKVLLSFSCWSLFSMRNRLYLSEILSKGYKDHLLYVVVDHGALAVSKCKIIKQVGQT